MADFRCWWVEVQDLSVRQIQANQPLKQHLPTVAGVSAKYGACVVWAKQLQWNAVEAL